MPLAHAEVGWYDVPMKGRGGKRGRHMVVLGTADELLSHVSTVVLFPITTRLKNVPVPFLRAVCPILKVNNPFLDHDSKIVVPWMIQVDRARSPTAIGELHPDTLAALQVRVRCYFALR